MSCGLRSCLQTRRTAVPLSLLHLFLGRRDSNFLSRLLRSGFEFYVPRYDFGYAPPRHRIVYFRSYDNNGLRKTLAQKVLRVSRRIVFLYVFRNILNRRARFRDRYVHRQTADSEHLSDLVRNVGASYRRNARWSVHIRIRFKEKIRKENP